MQQVLELICHLISIEDAISLLSTCQQFRLLYHKESFWMNMLKRHFGDRNHTERTNLEAFIDVYTFGNTYTVEEPIEGPRQLFPEQAVAKLDNRVYYRCDTKSHVRALFLPGMEGLPRIPVTISLSKLFALLEITEMNYKRGTLNVWTKLNKTIT